MSSYSLDNKWESARNRLSLLEQQLDPLSHRRLTAIGVGPGWRCLEVGGGGGGSVTRWLCEQVGGTGHVLATDIEPTLLEQVAYPQLEISRHDILNDPPPPAEFDLVHTRWLLHHLPDPVSAIRRMVSSVRPGGWILIEEPDFSPVRLSSSETIAAFWSELGRVVDSGPGGDSFWARNLLQEVGRLDLRNIGMEADQFLLRGGEGWAAFFSLTAQQLRAKMTGEGSGLTDEGFDAAIAFLADGMNAELGPLGIAVWGQKPN